MTLATRIAELRVKKPHMIPWLDKFELVIMDARELLDDHDYREFLLDARAMIEERKP